MKNGNVCTAKSGGDVLARQMESKSNKTKQEKRETRECESLTLPISLLNLLNMTSPACGQT